MLKLRKSNIHFFIGISLLIISFDLVMVKSVLFKENDQLLTIGISLDFVIVIPLLLYFFIYRKLNRKMVSILPFALLGYIALVSIVPSTGNGTLNVIKYIVIPLELMFIGYEVYKLYHIIIHFRRNRLARSHPIDTLRKTLNESFHHSKIVSLLVHEVSVIYYALFAWRKKAYLQAESTSFSYHKDSNWLIIILILCKTLLIEGICVHILLMQWSHPAAWILSLGNLYIIVLLIADYRAMCLSPILVSRQEIKVQYGIQMSLNVAADNIESVSIIKLEKLTKEDLKTAITPLVTESNVLIRLKNKITVIRLFGKRQTVDHVYLYLDKPHEFQVEYQRLIDEQNKV